MRRPTGSAGHTTLVCADRGPHPQVLLARDAHRASAAPRDSTAANPPRPAPGRPAIAHFRCLCAAAPAVQTLPARVAETITSGLETGVRAEAPSPDSCVLRRPPTSEGSWGLWTSRG